MREVWVRSLPALEYPGITFVNLAWSQWTYPQAKGEVLDDFRYYQCLICAIFSCLAVNHT